MDLLKEYREIVRMPVERADSLSPAQLRTIYMIQNTLGVKLGSSNPREFIGKYIKASIKVIEAKKARR